MKTRVIHSSLVLAFLLAAPPAMAQQDSTSQAAQPADTTRSAEEEAEARQTAEDWLAYLDEGEVAESYEATAEILKDQVTEDQWVRSISEVKNQIGVLDTRSFEAARQITPPQGAPQGEYVTVQYATAYANLEVQEIVVLFQEDGAWKVAGYFVRPTAPPNPPAVPSPPADTSGASADTTGGL